MDLSEEPVLDLRKSKIVPDRLSGPEPLPSFSFCFFPSHLCSPVSCEESADSMPHSTVLSPTFSVTQRVLSAGYTHSGKPTRPFKAYPKDPLSLSINTPATEAIDNSSNEAYLEFRHRMLLQAAAATCASKPKRSVSLNSVISASGGEQDNSKDATYWERRRKNNEAAKRSRDARRAKEDEIAIRAAFLEQENLKLKYKVVTLRNELSRLRCLLYAQ